MLILDNSTAKYQQCLVASNNLFCNISKIIAQQRELSRETTNNCLPDEKNIEAFTPFCA